MDNWKLALVVVVLCASMQTYQAVSCGDMERRVSSDWQEGSLEERVASQVSNLIKRSKAHLFYGLMGKRSGGKEPIPKDRRESLTRITPVATSTALDVSEVSRKQDSQEELSQLKYY